MLGSTPSPKASDAAPASRGEEREPGADEERRVRRLDPERDPREEARDDAVERHASCTARSVKYAAAASTTIAGKSDITDRPNDCGSRSSVYRWW